MTLPITGIATFGRYPLCDDLDNIQAEVGILGAPSDIGVGFLSGTRLGPRRIREASTQYGRGEVGFYDPERDETYLAGKNNIVDCGDAPLVQGDLKATLSNIENCVRKIAASDTLPVVLGGDHSISIPVAQALDKYENLTVIQIDAHLDWTDSRDGQKYGNGSPLRRMSEMSHIGDIVQIGLRGMGSSRKEDYEDARDYGCQLISAQEAKTMDVDTLMDRIPDFENCFVTIDIDGLDISIAPGTGSPSPGGLSFEWLIEFLEGISKKGNVAGFDLVEVAPQYDPTDTTTRTASLVILNFIAFILKNR
ncbi:agmatinase [Corticicoccus populi]|uniref:Agmatinase n=1 Tax=Corticicoccus populi TaxID=1812821 RepID=A0ABW5X120_9STAP